MFLRILFLAVISMQISACIATPRFTKKVSEDYEPPKKTDEIATQETARPHLSEQTKEEIRRQVQQEIRMQNAANATIVGESTTPTTVK